MMLQPFMTASASDAVRVSGILPNCVPATSDMKSMGVFNGDMSSNSYLLDRVCVPRFDQPPLSPAAQLLNEALEPLDVTENETLPIPSSAAEDFVGDLISPYGHLDALAVVSQSETPSVADLERNFNPLAGEMSPKTFQGIIKSLNEEFYQPCQGYNHVNDGMDHTLTFNEYHSQDIVTSTSCYNSQIEELHLRSIAEPALAVSTPTIQPNITTIWNSTPCVQNNTLYAQPGVSCGWDSTTPCIQDNNLCVQDNTSCAQQSAYCVQDGTYTQNAPCVQSNTFVQHSSTSVQDNISCIQPSNHDLYVQDNTQDNNLCARDNILVHHSSSCVQENTPCNSPWVQRNISCNIPAQDTTPCFGDNTPCSSQHSNQDSTTSIQHSAPAMKCSEVQQALPKCSIQFESENEKKEPLKAIDSGDHKRHKKSKEKWKHSQNATIELGNLTEQEVLRNGNDNKGKDAYDEAKGASNLYHSGHYHEPPIPSHYEMQVKKLELQLKEQDKKHSEQLQVLKEQFEERFEEQDKVLQHLKEQVNHLQATAQDVNANDDIEWLNKKQNMEIKMILTNQSISWKAALRKILAIAFGKKLLAQSCSVGRRNATYKPLDTKRLDVVRGLIFNTYGPNQEITNEAINVIVNSCCTTARRSLKQSI